MVPVPMRPVHTALTILASFLVAGALLPWTGRLRLACAAGAIAIVFVLLVSRLRAHTAPFRSHAADDTQATIARIRAERAARMRKRR